MKKLAFLAIFLLGFWATITLVGKQTSNSPKENSSFEQKLAAAQIAKLGPPKTSLFIPYWSLGESDAPFSSPKEINRPIDTAIYFSITPTSSGINKNNSGYNSIDEFVERTTAIENKLLTISMSEDSINSAVLANETSQKNIISQASETALEHNFDGIILDLEVGGIASTKLNTQIINFVKIASEITKKNNLTLAMTIYGDSFYRSRPYSIELLSPHVDQFYIMAYDFSKLWGTPGPNFPMKGREEFGYDMQTMLSDMLKFTTNDKLTVIFGLYGHDWTVDEQKRPFTAAKTVTHSQIQKEFIDSCEWKNCIIKRNPYAIETEINYIDNEQQYHIVWFEDSESVAQKIGLLKENGINSVSYWAYSYY